MHRTLPQKLGILLISCLGLWLVSRYLLPILLPFLLAAGLALAAEPPVRILHQRLKLPRGVASGIGVVITLLLAVLLVLALCALLLRELGQLAGILPNLGETAISGMESLESFLLNLAAGAPAAVSPILVGGVEGFFSDGTALVNQLMARVVQLASGVVTRIPDSALGFGTWILASFMISAKLPRIRQWGKAKLPPSWYKRYLPAVKRLKANLAGWLLAQLKLTAITFCLLSAGLLLLRIRYAPLWAAAISLLDALPILGTGTILIPWSLVCFLQGNPVQAVGLLGTYAAAALARSFLEPKLVGKHLGLDPLLTLLALYAGYRLWGILGMLLAPLLAVTAVQLSTAPKEIDPPAIS